ncbi:hypothetical protein N9201_01670 [bacterium]|nr:hypothetical protein [bacterium]
MTKLKINKNEEGTLPIWTGKIESDSIIEDLQLIDDDDWEEQHDGSQMLSYTPVSLLNIVNFFDTEAVIDNLLEHDLGDAFYKTWPTETILDPEFLKSAVVCHTKIIRMKPEHVTLPTSENRLLFGKIIVKLDDYLLTPPTMFVGNTEWPPTDIVFETDCDLLGATFYLNSNTFHTACENKSIRNVHLLVCDIKLDPLFLAK